MKKLSTLLLSTLLASGTILPAVQAVGSLPVLAEEDEEESQKPLFQKNAEDQYEISTATDLVNLANSVNGGTNYFGDTFILMNNIDLQNQEWTPIGNQANPFQGSFNGNGKIISNLSITKAINNAGLFGCTAVANGDVTPGTIQNLTLNNVTISKGGLFVGALIGTPFTTNVKNITLSGTVQISGEAYVGGLLGYNFYGTGTDLTVNVNSVSKVVGNSVINDEDYITYVGGIVGHTGEGGSSGRLINCTSNITVQGNVAYVGGIAGIANYGNTFSDCTCTGDVYLVGDSVASPYGIGGIAGTYNYAADQTETIDGTFRGTLYTGESLTNLTPASQIPGFDQKSILGAPHNDGVTSSNAGTLKFGETAEVAYVGNTYYSSIENAINECPVGSTVELLAPVNESTTDTPAVTINKLINVSSNGFNTKGIAISDQVKQYLTYKNGEQTDETNTGTDDINCNYNFVTSITIAPASTSTTTGRNVDLTATITYQDENTKPETTPALQWSVSPSSASFNPANPSDLSATLTSSTAGTYTVSAVVADSAYRLPDAIGTASVTYSAPSSVTPPSSSTPTPPEEEPEPEPEPETPIKPPVDTPTDDTDSTDDFKPNSGTNAGVSGTGEGFTEPGSQTLTDSTGASVTFTQNEDGTKAASTQNSAGEVTSSVVTVPQESITDNSASVSLGTNASGESLGIVGNKNTESSAPSLTVNLPTSTTEAKVTLPVVEGTMEPGTVAMLVGENGELTPIITTTINGENNTITIPLTGSQKIVILDNALTFSDNAGVPAYATQAAAFTSARRLMTGMGESTPKPFDYNGLTSRGQFATIMFRLEGEPSVSGAYPEGVTPGAWNADPARWMVENGYMGQGGSKFNPQQDITRDQIIAILYRMNGAPTADLSVLDQYGDASEIPSTDFRNAMAWGIEKGIIGQGVNELNPQDEASRAEIAAMIARVIENLY